MALRGIANVALTVAGDTETLREIEATFRALDDDGDGRVPYAAMVRYIKHGGFDLSDTEMDVLISQMDVDEAGFVRYDDWLAAMIEWRTVQARLAPLPPCAACLVVSPTTILHHACGRSSFGTGSFRTASA